MARQWGSREPNSFEVECGYCHQKFWTTSWRRKYCSDLCAKQVQRKQNLESHARKRPERVKVAVRKQEEEPRTEYAPSWHLSGSTTGKPVAYWYDLETARIPTSAEVNDFSRVETDLDEVLSLFRNDLVYGRFAELRSTVDPFRLIVASLNRTIDGVSPHRIEEMQLSMERTRLMSENFTPTFSDGSEKWHGTINGYIYHVCRCEACKKANRLYMRNYSRRKKQELDDRRAEVNARRRDAQDQTGRS